MTRDARRRVARAAGPLLLALVFVALTAWTWGKWPDALVDFGRELYVPWQLTEGQGLYTDIAYFNGPLSPWINATLFRFYGVSLRTLALANLLLIVVIGTILYRLLRIWGDRLTATAGSVVYLTIFAFGQFVHRGNYSYVAPYSHEATHGIALSALALWLLAVHLAGGRTWPVFGLGLAIGAAFLTKAEFVIALVPAAAAALALHHVRRGTSAGEAGRIALAASCGALLPPTLALGLLLTRLPPGEAITGVAGSWVYLFLPELGGQKFYRDIMGTSDLPDSLGRIGRWCLGYAAVLIPAGLAAFRLGLRDRDRPRPWPAAGLGVLIAGLLVLARERIDWQHLAAPFPVILGATLTALAYRLRRTGNDRDPDRRLVMALAGSIFALALLIKMLFNVRLLHYGFVLALPAAMVLVVLLLECWPRWIEGRGGRGPAFRAAALGVLAALVYVQLHATASWLSRRTVPVASGADAFLADERDDAFATLLARLGQLMGPGQTLLVVPEGVMLNYLLRAENPTPFVNFMPPEFIMFGEERMVRALEVRPPDWVAYVNRGVREYGFRMMGQDYGLGVMGWIRDRYRPVERVLHGRRGEGPEARFAMILRRR